MSDYGDDFSGPSKLTHSWLNVPSPKALLDRTTKFVLNAAHGKSRSLIPTSDSPLRTSRFDETGVVDWEEDSDDNDDGEYGFEENGLEEEAAGEEMHRGHRVKDGMVLVPEVDVLRGYWNTAQIVSHTDSYRMETVDDQDSTRSVTPPGMLRIRVDRRTRAKQPARRRTGVQALGCKWPRIARCGRQQQWD
ncbi:hypothetical protein GQ54DRAFT_126374 [Martensiomyces pterosporus]|nr:hypothetical protein GQ54DRAFT_126374 [Martensiomyces pterosporus]